MFPVLFMNYSGINISEFIHSSCSIGLLRKKKKEVLNDFLDNTWSLHFDTNLTRDIEFWSRLQNSNLFWRGKKTVLRRMDTGNRFYFKLYRLGQKLLHIGSLKWAPPEQFFVVSSEKYWFSKKIVKFILIFGARWLLLKNAHVSPKCFKPMCNNFWPTLCIRIEC